MKILSFLTNPIFWRAYKRNLIVGVALLLIALFGFNVVTGNNPLKRGPSTALAVEAGYCENGWTFNGGDAGKDENWSYTNCGVGGGGGGTSSNSGSWQYLYPECDWSSNKVYEVYQHSGTGEYGRRNYHYQDGACGYNSNNLSQSSVQNYAQQQQQSGSWQFVYPECDWSSRQVYDVYWHSGTGQYDRRNPHFQEGACGYVTEWEGAGCNGRNSVWGIWDRQGGNLKRVERDYGVVPGECNNPVATPVPQRTYQDRQECDGQNLVMRRYWSDNRTEIVANYGHQPGNCGYSQPVQRRVAPAPVYAAPVQQAAPVYAAPVQPVAQQQVIPQIQAACEVSATQITRGSTVNYFGRIRTGGTGRVGRTDFRGEQAQSTNGTFTVQYNTAGAKQMSATVYDADPRAGSQVVDCPVVVVSDPSVAPAGVFVQPAVQQPVYQQQPIYQQQPVYQQPVYAAPAPVMTTQQPVSAPQQPYNYCPMAGQQQLYITGSTVYCSNPPQIIAYTYSGTQIIGQQIVSSIPTGSAPAQVSTPTAPAPAASATGSTIQCPAGYTAQAYGTSVYCVTTGQTSTVTPTSTNQTKPANVVLAAAGTQPQVTAQNNSAITELPRTGLPLAAWGVSGLLPLGLKLRKGKKMDDQISVNDIWVARQINKG